MNTLTIPVDPHHQALGASPRERGASLVEITVVVIIIFIVAAVAIPGVVSSMRNAHLRGAASDYAGLLELTRMYSVRDNRYYSARIIAAPAGVQVSQAYIDMLPKSTTGASGNGGTSVATGDPEVTLPAEVAQEAVGEAPNTSNLESQLLPATTPVTPTDTSVTPATFGPRGLPCTPVNVTGGSICDSSGGPTAYWTFFKNTNSNNWQAVTITPAGRIQKWYYNGSTWSLL